MKEWLIITDLTRMGGDRVCLAGYTQGLECVRPELRHGHFTEPWLYHDGKPLVRPFACIEVDLQEHRPAPPHTEDWLIAPGPPVAGAQMTLEDRRLMLAAIADSDVANIFGAPVHHEWGYWIAAGEGNRSLGTVKARVWDVLYQQRDNGKWEYRLRFTDASGAGYRLSVTDLAFRYFVDHERLAGRISGRGFADAVTTLLTRSEVVYLRVGLARGWDQHPDRCYLQINGIYTFPDYLDGRCFADFAPNAPTTSFPSVSPVRRAMALAHVADEELENLPF